MNATDIKSKLTANGGRADRLAKSDLPVEDIVRELYQAAFTRDPRPEELRVAVEYVVASRVDAANMPLDSTRARQENLQDLLWALMNTKEFIFNH